MKIPMFLLVIIAIIFNVNSISQTSHLSKHPLKNGFSFTIQCLDKDFEFCNKIESGIINVGKTIARELLIYQVINIQVKIYPFEDHEEDCNYI